MGSRIIKYLIYLFNSVIDVIYGSGDCCVLCRSLVDEEELLCGECIKKLAYHKFEGIIRKDDYNIRCYSSSYYGGVTKELIMNLKYKSDFRSGMVLVELLERLLNDVDPDIDIMTYVPSGDAALYKRGYNQSRFLCSALSKRTDKRFDDLIVKKGCSKDQIGLSGEERWENIKSSFQVRERGKVNGKKILLIDDVITTGATAFYCAAALLEAGSKEVLVLTAAKSKI